MLLALFGALGPATVAADVASADPARAATVTASPAPGSELAAPATAISVRGLSTEPSIHVTASATGGHAGSWRAHSDGAGFSFVLDETFAPGESVEVEIGAAVQGAAPSTDGSRFTFAVARPAPPGEIAEEAALAAPQTRAAAPFAAAAAGPYRSRPDLNPPPVQVDTPASGTAPGYLFAGLFSANEPAPGLVFDNTGEPVWIPTHPMINLDRIDWYGRPALVYFDNTDASSLWNGVWPVLDNHYREIARVQAGNGYEADLHEFLPTSRGTVILVIYNWVTRDLRPYGHPSEFARVIDSVIQEVDPRTGLVLFEWHSLDPGHLPLTDSYESLSSGDVDYSHINSVDVDTDDNLVASFRNTNSVVKVDRDTGEVIWILGGKRSDFDFDPGDPGISRQHDARVFPNGTITIYDNGNDHATPRSRVVRYDLDVGAGTADTVDEWLTSPPVFTSFMGGSQALSNGNMLASWSVPGRATEFAPNGSVAFDASLPATHFSYRIRRHPWTGAPAEAPGIAVDVAGTSVTAYASWNGSTQVASWDLLAGPNSGALSVVGTASRTGFETQIGGSVSPGDNTFVVRARAGGGKVLAQSDTYTIAPDDPRRTWGAPTDLPRTGDFSGDGVDEQVVFRPSTATWYVKGVNEAGMPWGAPGDIPFVGDFDGDSIDEFGVFRPSTTTWYVRGVDEGGTRWAGPSDIPFAGDFDGDGTDEFGVYRSPTTTWYVRGVDDTGTKWAIPGDLPAIGDYDGDETDDLGVFRDRTGMWYVRGVIDTGTSWAGPGDLPTVLDHDGDGESDLAVFRPSNATWYQRWE